MLPISDDNRGRHSLPLVTWALIAINVVVYAYQATMNNRELWQFLQEWAVIPDRITNGAGYETLVTSAFLHGSWFHLGSNMLFLWIFGDNVEDVMGHARFLIFYLLTAVAASFAQIMINTDSSIPMVGASGAVSGVMAAYILLFPHGRVRTLVIAGIFVSMAMLPAWMIIGYWFIIQVVSGVASLNLVDGQGGGVAFWAHIGGFLAGLALVFLFRDKDRQREQLSQRVPGRGAPIFQIEDRRGRR